VNRDILYRMKRIAGDREVLEMALVGYRSRKNEIEREIAEIELHLGTKRRAAENSRRKMIAAARKRIADAQSRRWAAYRATHQTD